MGCASSTPLTAGAGPEAPSYDLRGADPPGDASVAGKVRQTVTGMADALPVQDMIDGVTNAKDEAMHKLQDFGESVKDKVESVVEDVEDKIGEVLGTAKDKTKEAEEAVEAAQEEVNAAQEELEKAAGEVEDLAESAGEKVEEKAEEAKEAVDAMVEDLEESLPAEKPDSEKTDWKSRRGNYENSLPNLTDDDIISTTDEMIAQILSQDLSKEDSDF